jgi:two-component system cell cycle sensor histidine kinase/response regulator CckA
LSVEQAHLLLGRGEPQEVECISREPDGLRALRFRSQPSEDIQLILVSDVTQRKTEEIRNRQVATLQLIGRIARGVAHDFNNILCAVSGHAELVRREALTENQRASLQAIAQESRRGASLAAQVLRLSQAEAQGQPCSRLADQVTRTVELLKVGLSSQWRVALEVQEDLGPTLLTGNQVEQIILSLALLAADELGHPGHLQIRARRPEEGDPIFDVGERCAAAIWIAAAEAEGALASPLKSTPLEAGVVVSVVRTILGEAGGHLDIFGHDGRHGYRLCIPALHAAGHNLAALGILSEEQARQVALWRVLLAGARTAPRDNWIRRLRDLGMQVRTAEDIVATLHAVEAPGEISVLVLERKLLGDEAAALLRAVRKLRPHTGLVVLSEDDFAWNESLHVESIRETEPSLETLLQVMLRSVEPPVSAPTT